MNRLLSAFLLVACIVVGFLYASPAHAELIFHMRFKDLPPVINPMDTVVVYGTLFNNSASDENLGVIGGFQMQPPGFDFEIGGFCTIPNGYSLQWGPDGSLQNQFEGVNLAPGETFDFVFATLTPNGGAVPLSTYSYTGQLQLFKAAPDRPSVGYKPDEVYWNVVEELPIPEPEPIPIDIQPFNRSNIIHLTEGGIIPVAILSTEDFDAFNEVDKASLTFGKTGGEDSLAYCLWWTIDVNRDGLQDMVCYFWTAKTGFEVGDTEGILRGYRIEGHLIEGCDSVKVVKLERWQ